MNQGAKANSPTFQLISDDELYEHDHFLEEDFRGATLKIKSDDDQDEEEEEEIEKGVEAIDLKPSNGVFSLALYGKERHSSGNGVPQISVTPMTPPESNLSSPDAHSTISLTSAGSPRSSNGHHIRNHWSNHGSKSDHSKTASPQIQKDELEAKEFFAFRDALVQNCLEELQSSVNDSIDGMLRGIWLLTEIDYWGNDKERCVLLCDKSFFIINYDFIRMNKIEEKRIDLSGKDLHVIQGELKYPDKSLTPRLGGVAGGLAGVFKGVVPRVSSAVQCVGNVVYYRTKGSNSNSESNSEKENASSNNGDVQPQPSSSDNEFSKSTPDATSKTKTSIMSALSIDSSFEPRRRNVQGLRLIWNSEMPLSSIQKWNPFSKEAPYLTFTSHPLCWHKEGIEAHGMGYDIESFSKELIDILSESEGGDSSPICKVEYRSIIIETYIGLGSLIHNHNQLGYYKMRGKVSF